MIWKERLEEVKKYVKEKYGFEVTKKMMIGVATTTVVVVSGGVGVWLYLQGTGTTQSGSSPMNQYMEETVRIDDIVVGISEMGSTTMNTSDIVLGYATTVLEVYAKAGTYVQAGDQLALVDASEQESAVATLESELYQEQLQLQSTVLSAEAQKIQADSTYQEKLLIGELAELSYSLSITDLENGYQDILQSISDMYIEIVDTETEISNLSSTYGISSLESNVSSYSATVTSLQNQLNHAKTCTTYTISVMSHLSESVESIAEMQADIIDNVEEGEIIPFAEVKELDEDAEEGCPYPDWEHDVEVLTQQLVTAQQNLSDVESKLTQANNNIESDTERLYSQITNLYDSIASQELAKANYEVSMELKRLEIESDYNMDLYEYETAKQSYNNTVAQVNNDIANAQEKVNTLTEEIQEYEVVTSLVVAPIDGYIMTHSDAGSSLNANNTVITIAEREEVNILVSIDQEDIANVFVGMDTNVVFDAYDQVTVKGKIDSISIVPAGGMQSSVSYTVTIVCDLTEYADLVIYQGMTATVTFIQKQTENVLVVSNKCIINENGKQYVKVKMDTGQIQQREIKTGFSDGFDVEVTTGIEEGEIVIIESAVMQYAN